MTLATALSPTDAFKSIIAQLARELGANVKDVLTTVELLDGGATVPFIARYRKEVTGGMLDTQLRLLDERLPYLRELEERRATILLEVATQGKLSLELRSAIISADTKQRLEDLYAPYKPKRRTRAMIAKEAGLEPLALNLLANRTLDPQTAAAAFVQGDIATVKAALDGARDILAEQFAENPNAVSRLRELVWQGENVYATKLEEADSKPDAHKFRDYFEHNEPLHRAPSHRVLAMLRGQAQGILKLNCELPAHHEALASGELPASAPHPLEGHLIKQLDLTIGTQPADAFIRDCVRWAWRVKLQGSLESDVMARIKDQAQIEAVKVFAANVRDVLLAAPAGQSVVMGLDPGIRTGVKVAIISPTGAVLDTATVYPFEPRKDVVGSLAVLKQLAIKHRITLIAIGNGTASRETDTLAAQLMKDLKAVQNNAQDSLPAIKKVVVSEAGASVYSASELAGSELPDLDVSLRGAVSIARRLQDPLAELVKIDPKAIGVGQYQHDLPPRQLAQGLDAVVEDCVNAVGVDANTASASLLARVSGLTATTARAIVATRDANGAFANRAALKAVPRLGDKAFEQCAGFLRITGDNPLDASSVHPEAYPLVQQILQRVGKPLSEVMGRADVLQSLVPESFVNARFGLPTVQDVLAELAKPGRDPRGTFQYASFDESVQSMGDLREGMILEGVVSNVAAFGAFVDIGVHQDGLVHVSELGAGFVKDPRTVVKAGQTVKVRVVEVDAPRKRIALSLRLQASPADAPAPLGHSNSHNNSHNRAANRDSRDTRSNTARKPAPAPLNTAFSNAFADALKFKNKA
jgi:protein Tex